MKWKYILIGMCLPLSLQAQFNGGPGDGVDVSGSIQIDLKGVPQGDRPLYAGSMGDGFSYATGGGGLNNVSVAFYTTGGRGDGFSDFRVQQSLNGVSLAQLFGGGDGDGFAKLMVANSLDGVDMAQVFGGGTGDGHDHDINNSSLNGVSMAILFGGGNGDGFDFQQNSLGLNGTAISALFGGGNGDGFDMEKAATFLAGTSAAALYGGGDGEGHDVATFSGAVIPFPVAYLSFDAFPDETFVVIQWVTASEINNDFFTIERSKDGLSFEELIKVQSQGSGADIRTYEALDKHPYEGISYYRLRQTDFDGNFSFTEVVQVLMENQASWDFVLSPNPNDGRILQVDLTGIDVGENIFVQIADLQGKIVFEADQNRLPLASNRLEINLEGKLAAGSYVVKVGKSPSSVSAKILIVK